MADAGSFNADLGINMQFNIDGAGLVEMTKTIKEISKGKDLQRYWKDVESATDSAAKAIGRYSKNTQSKGLAENFLKQINALKAITNKENISDIFPKIDVNFDELIKSAKKIAPEINSEFSTSTFSQAFKTFDLLKNKGIELGEVFRKLADYSNTVDENFKLHRENINLKDLFGDQDIEKLKSSLSEIQKLRNEAEDTFNNFLNINKISKTDSWGDEQFSKYFDGIRNGSLTATEAISKFKIEYAYLLEDGFKANNNTFGLEQLQTFSEKLDSIFHQVEETSNKINDIISNGVITKSVQDFSKDNSLTDSQRSMFGNLLQDEESLKSITTLFQKLITESTQTKNTELFNTEQFSKIESLFENIESMLSSIKSVLVDVGDGEELSPLLKSLESIREAAANIKIGLNLDLGDEVSEKLNQKVSQATTRQLEAYRKLFSTMKGTGKTNKEMFQFYEPDDANASELIGIYQGMIKRAKEQFKIGNSNVYKKLLGSAYDDLEKEIKNANAQLSRAETKRSENGILGDLFGKPIDLSGVIEQLSTIVTKLDELSTSAKTFSDSFKSGLNLNISIDEVETLTTKVKELEDEITKLKASSATATAAPETNISSESSSMEQVQKSTDQAVQAKEDFAKANAGVQASVNESKSPLQLEAELMDKIAESARKAANAKKEFVKANGKVTASAKESNVSLNSDLTSGHSEVSEPTGIKKYQKKGYKAHDTGNHDNEKKVVNKKELGNALKELQSEIIANIDSANSFIKDVTDFYDSNDNLVKTQMKVLDKNGNMSTYTTSYSMDKDGNATAWTSHIDSQKFEDKNQEYQNQLKTIRELSAEKQKLQEQDRKSEVNQALKDQLYAYKQIQSIREKIASTDDENLIAELEKQKQTYQEQYLTATKILKNNSDLYNSESRLNELLQIGLKTTQKISEAEIKRNSAADNKKVKEWDNVNAKNQADIWKENQKAIRNYVNAVKKLQDLLAEDKGTGSKAAAIEKQQEKIKQLEEEALNARAILSSMVNPHTSDASTWDAWVKMMDKLSNASHDAKAAVDDVKKSIQAAQASEIKSMNDGLAEYDAKMRSFNSRKPEDRSSDYSTALKGYTDALERYRNELQKIQNHPELINETEINNLKNMRQELDKAATSLKGIDKGSTAISRDKMISKISDYMKKNSAMSKEFKSELEGLIQKLKTLGAEADTTRIADEFFKITQRIREAGQEGKKFWDVVKEKAWYGLAGTIGTYFGFNDLIQYGKQGVQIVRELDTQLTEMMKVSNESAQSLKNYQNTTFDVADTVGTTAKQIQTSTADYMRLGESLDEAAESAKTANILLNVSEFSNIEDATKSLVAMGQAYKNLDKLTIVDKLNEVGKLIAQTYSNV